MNKNKGSLKDLYAIRKNKDVLFERPLVSQKRFFKILSGKNTSFNIDQDLIQGLEDINIQDQFTGVTFGELIAEKIKESNFTLQQVAENINLPIETLYDILDEQILPWIIPIESLNELCLLLNLSKKVVINSINNTNIDEKTISTPLLNNYVARSQDGISSSTLNSALYDANLKIAIEREIEKRDRFIALFSK